MRLAKTLLLTCALTSSATVMAMDPAATLIPFKQALKQTLMQALSGGPAAAVDACRLQAPALATRYSNNDVRVGRASHKLRNPENAPAPWLAEIIDSYLAEPSQRAPVTTVLADGRNAYVEPIVTQAMCLACHGSNIPADVSARLHQHYPQDQATGFREGDLRGVFWVTWTETPD